MELLRLGDALVEVGLTSAVFLAAPFAGASFAAGVSGILRRFDLVEVFKLTSNY